jgi:hypothetical protein
VRSSGHADFSLQLESLVLRKQLHDLGMDLLFLGRVCNLVAPLDQLFDLLLNDLLLCLRLSLFGYPVFIVHRPILLLSVRFVVRPLKSILFFLPLRPLRALRESPLFLTQSSQKENSEK